MRTRRWLVGMVVLVAACTTGAPSSVVPAPSAPPPTTPAPTTRAPTTAAAAPPSDPVGEVESAPTSPASAEAEPFAPPPWLGARYLPEREDGFGEILPTPPELEDRRIATVDLLPPPANGEFAATISDVPAEVVARSTWGPHCPVKLRDLAYVTVSHYGFDGGVHTGELIVGRTVAEDVVEVFRRLHAARFPIEQMRVINRYELDLPPTGDGNETTAFVCRPAVNSGNWSQHAYGLAIDVNPFHNPYLKDGLVIPELASAYLDREEVRPGMVVEGDVVTEAFAEIGWTWGGEWRSLKDWMHFSLSGT